MPSSNPASTKQPFPIELSTRTSQPRAVPHCSVSWAATGIRLDGSPFLFIPLDEADFVDEFMRKHTLAIDYDGTAVAHLSLEGSSAAIVEMVECQEKVDRGEDPFKN